MLLQECACGEPLLDDHRKCPKCGKRNPGFRQSRWRIFWPEVDSEAGVDEAITLGYWAAFVSAALGAIVSIVPAFGVGLAGLADAAIYALCGVGVRNRWRIAAVIGFLLFTANLVVSGWRGGGIGVLTAFIFVGFLNGLRGTFARPKVSDGPRTEAAG